MADNYGRDIDITNDVGSSTQVPHFPTPSADYVPPPSIPDTRKSQEELIEKRSSLQRMSEMLKSKDDGKTGGSVRGSFNKRMKSLFKSGESKPKADPYSLDVSGMSHQEPQQIQPHSSSYSGHASESLHKNQSSFDAALDSYRAKSIPLVDYSDPDIMELKDPPQKEIVRMSTIINVLLVLTLIAGIIMTALGSYDEVLTVIGPCFIVLSSFALVGKLFFTLFWEEEPCPRLRPYITATEDTIGGLKDPYNLKTQTTEPTSSMYQYGNPRLSMEPGAGQTAVYSPRQSELYSVPAPVVYDADIDTRPRSHYSRASSTEALDQGKDPNADDYPDGRSTPY